jgi:hypothetical protein
MKVTFHAFLSLKVNISFMVVQGNVFPYNTLCKGKLQQTPTRLREILGTCLLFSEKKNIVR